MPLNLPTIHSKFPALKRPAIFFDNPGGTHATKPVINRYKIIWSIIAPTTAAH